MATGKGFDLDDASVKLFFCGHCYENSQVHLLKRLSDGSRVPAWPYLREAVISTNDTSDADGTELNSHNHDHSHAHADPNVCDCVIEGKKTVHDEILGCISEMEKLSDELEIQHGVTAKLLTEVSAPKELDLSVPLDGRRGLLRALSKRVTILFLGDDKIETPPNRPLCTVYSPNIFHCHWGKMMHYAPANCNCTPTACSCMACILCHVEHCVDDYRNAIERVSLGITKVRAMLRTKTIGTNLQDTDLPGTDGCAMPGVRKAKHLKNFVKAQKDAYNTEK